jgi:DNA-binding transcriptional regulator GbsR (MarR family)
MDQAYDEQPDGRDDRRAELAEEFAGHLIEAGMQRMASRVYACIFMADEGALTAAELAGRLRVSPGAISGAVGYLSQMYLIVRERQPGSRRERYRLNGGVMYESIANRSKIMDRWADTMRKGMAMLGPDTPAGARMVEAAEFMDFLREELAGTMARWQQRVAERGTADAGTRGASGTGSG